MANIDESPSPSERPKLFINIHQCNTESNYSGYEDYSPLAKFELNENSKKMRSSGGGYSGLRPTYGIFRAEMAIENCVTRILDILYGSSGDTRDLIIPQIDIIQVPNIGDKKKLEDLKIEFKSCSISSINLSLPSKNIVFDVIYEQASWEIYKNVNGVKLGQTSFSINFATGERKDSSDTKPEEIDHNDSNKNPYSEGPSGNPTSTNKESRGDDNKTEENVNSEADKINEDKKPNTSNEHSDEGDGASVATGDANKNADEYKEQVGAKDGPQEKEMSVDGENSTTESKGGVSSSSNQTPNSSSTNTLGASKPSSIPNIDSSKVTDTVNSATDAAKSSSSLLKKGLGVAAGAAVVGTLLAGPKKVLKSIGKLFSKPKKLLAVAAGAALVVGAGMLIAKGIKKLFKKKTPEEKAKEEEKKRKKEEERKRKKQEKKDKKKKRQEEKEAKEREKEEDRLEKEEERKRKRQAKKDKKKREQEEKEAKEKEKEEDRLEKEEERKRKRQAKKDKKKREQEEKEAKEKEKEEDRLEKEEERKRKKQKEEEKKKKKEEEKERKKQKKKERKEEKKKKKEEKKRKKQADEEAQPE